MCLTRCLVGDRECAGYRGGSLKKELDIIFRSQNTPMCVCVAFAVALREINGILVAEGTTCVLNLFKFEAIQNRKHHHQFMAPAFPYSSPVMV